jgi:hypothetical protein
MPVAAICLVGFMSSTERLYLTEERKKYSPVFFSSDIQVCSFK